MSGRFFRQRTRLELEESRRLRALIADGVIAAQSIAKSLKMIEACQADRADLTEKEIVPALDDIAEALFRAVS